MGLVLQRTSFSPNIKERKDLSCAVFTSGGELIAQAAHIPVHLGSMATAVREAINSVEFHEGDMVLLNDPYRGGTHLPDMTLVAPVFCEGDLLLFVANRAHHADVGGVSSGSMPLSTSLFQEGLIVPPVKILRRGSLNEDVLKLVLSNVRTADEREGDLMAQVMANTVGIKRLTEILREVGKDRFIEMSRELMDYGEKLMEETVKKIPDGEYTFEDLIEDDGLEKKDIRIKVRIEIRGSRAVVDFSDSDPQTRGPMNAVRSITISATYYAFRCLLQEDAPTNDGCFRPIKVITKKGTIVDADFPAPVSGGNVETSQRIVDVVLGALARAMPDTIPAASQGTMNNLTVGGVDPKSGKEFAYYETIGGGMGAWAGGDGESAIHSHMTNTMNTPVEALEHSYPFLVRSYAVRRGSGGKGVHTGGDGIVREVEFLTDVEVTVLSARRRIPAYGLFGGSPGMVGKNILIENCAYKILPGKFTRRFRKGSRLRIETPGGGGYA